MKYVISSLLIALIWSCTKENRIIKVKGSDTEVNLAVQLAEQFHESNKSIFISVSGGGSGLGIASLLNNTADLANSSRRINEKESALFIEQGIAIDSFIFAQDAIAFVVADDLPLDSISTTQLGNILSGKSSNWQEFTGVNMPINIYGRQSNSGTHSFIKSKLHIDFSIYAKQMNGNAQILEAIRTDHSGIGYVGAGYVINGGDKGLKILTVFTPQEKAISPLDAQMIAEGRYFFQRPLYQYYKKESLSLVQPLLLFEQSPQGQAIIKAAGYYPTLLNL